MDTKTLITEAKARFNHNAAKAYLREKYESKLILASHGGLWKANIETINYLNGSSDKEVIIVDTFGNPTKVDRMELLMALSTTYKNVMSAWYNEWTELENKR